MNKKKWLFLSVFLLVTSVVFTFLVKTFDVRPVGPEGSLVGFASLNSSVHEFLGENPAFGTVTDVFLGVAFLSVPIFLLIGLRELFKEKSLKKVEKSLFVLGAFYCFVALVFVLFEHFVVNFRPILMDGVLEPSYPSSHTLLSICLAFSASIEASLLLEDSRKKSLVWTFSWVVALIVVVGRLISGVHWTTDILGGVLISATLLSFFKFALACLPEKS